MYVGPVDGGKEGLLERCRHMEQMLCLKGIPPGTDKEMGKKRDRREDEQGRTVREDWYSRSLF